MEVGVSLSSEEFNASELVKQAVRAEEAGFDFLGISDHYHPWTERQGESPFVWSVLGGIAASTQRVEVGTMVTCPTLRTHPAIIAQAAATTASMMPGRFFLGVGSGENLNEHVVGAPWPRAEVRIAMLEEAIEIIRLLWEGKDTSFEGDFYTVANARIFSLPGQLPPIYVAAAGSQAAELAGRAGDGLISTSPQAELVEAFRGQGNEGPRLGQLTTCLAGSEAEGKRLAHEVWPNAALSGAFKQELPLPLHFEEATKPVTEDQVAASVICSLDPQKHVEAIKEYEAAGFSRVYIHQVGPDQERFVRFYRDQVLPALTPAPARR